MEFNDNNVFKNSDTECANCKQIIEDVKSIILCTLCKNAYHAKCESMELRGFHTKKTSWKCKACIAKGGDRPRKRIRIEENSIDQNTIEMLNAALEKLTYNTNEMHKKIDYLIAENDILKQQIAELKSLNYNEENVQHLPCTSKSYAHAVVNNNKVLVVKKKSDQSEPKEIKEDLRRKVNPVEIGVGVSMGRSTKGGGIILNCGNEKEISNVQTEIQSKLGDQYQVDRPKILNHRLKVVGVNENEYAVGDELIIEKIIRQNDLSADRSDFKMNLLRRTNVFNKRFNLVFEVDSATYDKIISKEKVNLGWNRCRVFIDYGVIRCLNCCKYGHLSKDCKDKQACGKCGSDHNSNVCVNNFKKCKNCEDSNQRYGLSLSTDHTVWDVTKCEVYRQSEQLQRRKFIQ